MSDPYPVDITKIQSSNYRTTTKERLKQIMEELDQISHEVPIVTGACLDNAGYYVEQAIETLGVI